MLLAWRSKEIRDVCASLDGLDRAWPEHADTAKLLLALVAAAPELDSLRALRSLDVTPSADASTENTFSIRIEEIEMIAAAIDERGRSVPFAGTGDFWARVGGATSLEIIRLSASDATLESAAAA